jgi:fluoride ion exporter CrcB/FEX
MQLDAVRLAVKSRRGLAASYLLLSAAVGLLAGELGAVLARAEG